MSILGELLSLTGGAEKVVAYLHDQMPQVVAALKAQGVILTDVWAVPLDDEAAAAAMEKALAHMMTKGARQLALDKAIAG